MRIAGIQFCAGREPGPNLARAGAQIAEAAAQGARFIVLPENFACYGGDYRALAEREGAAMQAWLAAQAREQGVWLLGGTLPLVQRADGSAVAAPRVRAASLLYGPDGALQARYDKLHLFDAQVADAQGSYQESARFEAGDRLRVAEVGGFGIGLAVCYDLRFPSLARALVDRGAQVLVYPSAFTAVTGAAHWRLLLCARAVETGCYVLGVNQCGQHSERRASFGHSLLADPWGRVVAELDDAPGILLAELRQDEIDETRRRLPVHTHQRLLTGLPDDIRDD